MMVLPTTHRRLYLRMVFIVVLGGLLYAGLRLHPVPEVFHEEDKFNHLLGFAVLVVCMRLAFPRVAWWWQVAAALGVGIGIELLQSLEPARTASIWDFLFDALGVGVGWLILQLPVLRRWCGS